MRVILHLGAQRSATTTFQRYMRANAPALAAEGIGFWGPHRLRSGGLFEGLYAGPNGDVPDAAVFAARRKVAAALRRTEAQGLHTLVISDENMIGSVKGNMRRAALYPDAGLRLSAFVRAIGRPIDKVMLGIRPLGGYWRSALAYGVWRGADVPEASKLDAIVHSERSWRDVVVDVAQACGQAPIDLHRFEAFAATPNARLATALECSEATLPEACGEITNEAPSLTKLRRAMSKRGLPESALQGRAGRWEPFSRSQLAMLDETYADDIFWCAAGAGGVARLIERKRLQEAGTSLPAAWIKGHDYEQARRLDQAS